MNFIDSLYPRGALLQVHVLTSQQGLAVNAPYCFDFDPFPFRILQPPDFLRSFIHIFVFASPPSLSSIQSDRSSLFVGHY